MQFKAEVNERIRAYNVRVIDENGEQKGVMDTRAALAYARNLDLDLVKIADANPPVCKVVDANKYLYEQKKAQKLAAKKQREAIVTVKEVQLRVTIDTNDLKIKARKAKEFLAEGDKVKVVVRFRGRENAMREQGHQVIQQFIAELGESKTERPVTDVGRELSLLLAPVAPKVIKE